MASRHTASCKCGYSKEITVGGLMDGYLENSTFPFYCQQCGLVEANIARIIGQKSSDSSSVKAICPECGNRNIDPYGKPPASVTMKKQTRTLQAWNFEANKEGNLCPACKEMTLIFNHANIFYD